MSRGTATPPPRGMEPLGDRSGYEAFIEERLRRTRRQVKGVDLTDGLIVLAIGTLLYLLAAVLIDHRLVSGGLGFWGRVLLLVVLLVGVGWYSAVRIVVPVLGRINPIFAAHTIEQSRPSLKNSLINFLLLRAAGDEVPRVVYQAVEQRAAADLTQIDVEAAVDRRRTVRLGYALVVVVAVFCLYLAISPKRTLSSAARVLWPWSSIPAPTRVTIEEIKPGNATVFHGDHVTVSAEVRGEQEGETVALYYTTADGQSVDQQIPMGQPEGGYPHQYECQLPPEELGFQQDVSYYLSAGDCTTPQFTVSVRTAPTILVERIEYDYPGYTGFARRVVPREGDVRAIEGTEVTLHATANGPIEWARIDLGCTGLREVDMRASGGTAMGKITLRLDRNDPNLPEFDCYQLRFRDDAGEENPRPIRHQIEVVRDLPPEVYLVEPPEEEVVVARNGRLEIRVRAQDPDFALRKVMVRAECDGRKLVIPPMLDELHRGEFWGSYVFWPAEAEFEGGVIDPAAGGLKAGDRVRYWAEAEDNKEPDPGRAASPQQWITIVEPAVGEATAEQPEDGGEGTADRSQGGRDGSPDSEEGGRQEAEEEAAAEGAGEEPEDGGQPGEEQQEGPSEEGGQEDAAAGAEAGQEGGSSQGDGTGGQAEPGTEGPGQPQPSEGPSSGRDEPIDAETQPGDAVEEILRHREQQQQSRGEQQPGETQDGAESGEPQSLVREPAGGDSQDQTPGEPSSAGPRGEQESSEGEGANDEPGQRQQEPGSGDGEPQEADAEQDGEPQEGEPEQSPGEPGEQESSGRGGESGEGRRGSAPQGPDRFGEQEPGETERSPRESPPQAEPSSATDRGESDAEGETSGDRSGRGDEGPGQQSPQPGTGAGGSHTEADEGGSAAQQQGDGETGPGAGDGAESEERTGSPNARRGGDGSDGMGDPGPGERGSRPTDQRPPPGTEAAEGESPGGGQLGGSASDGPGGQNRGNPLAGGGLGGEQDGTPPQPEPTGGEEPNLEYSREQLDLALEHLRDQMDRGDVELLDRLGMTRAEAEEWIRRWEELQQAAGRDGAEGVAARSEFERALESLGLRRSGTQIGGEGGTDGMRDLREAVRYDPPSDWSELFRAYTRGVAGEGRQ